ncbi:MAG: DUF4924 family protein [Crocinitomicaceae bacterium]|nr:DUF4924 family protein [Crocinitomicaceae bacterium]MBK8925915.1 DUF4924 family protein [Crocinitomicaceae bacterium]
MLIARRTLENNIAEHVIYMFQIEDLIRANNFDTDNIVYTIIAPQIKDERLLQEYRAWYEKLITQMQDENIKQSGHLSEINEILMELLLLHNTLINIIQNKKYLELFEKALPALQDFQHKSNAANVNLVEVGFNALYSKLILKLKGQAFSQATEDAFAQISTMLGYLALYYKKMKQGELNFANN